MEKELSVYFSEVEAPGVEGRCLHLLTDILMISLLTYLTGGTDFQDMHLFTEKRGSSFKDLLKLPNGVPSSDTFERVFKKIKSKSLHNCPEHYGKDILTGLQGKQTVSDGKKLKGVSPHSKGNSGLYMLHARVSENRMCTGQEKAEEKSNETTAIPEVLPSPDIEEAAVSTDATGTQTKMAEQITDRGGHYFLPVKGNRQGLPEDLEHAFREDKGVEFIAEVESDHGRIENRRCSILQAGDFLPEENRSARKHILH